MAEYINRIGYVAGIPCPIEQVAIAPGSTRAIARLRASGHECVAIYGGTKAQLLLDAIGQIGGAEYLQDHGVDLVVATTDIDREDLWGVLEQAGLRQVSVTVVRGGQCANALLAMQYAVDLIRLGKFRSALVISCTKPDEAQGRVLREGVTIVADAASCAHVSETAGLVRIEGSSFLSRTDLDPALPVDQYFMHVAALFRALKAALKAQVPDGVGAPSALLSVNSGGTAEFVASVLGLPESICFTRNVARLGHAFDSDYLINLLDHLRLEAAPVGDSPLLFGGLGTRSAALLRLRRCATDMPRHAARDLPGGHGATLG